MSANQTREQQLDGYLGGDANQLRMAHYIGD